MTQLFVDKVWTRLSLPVALIVVLAGMGLVADSTVGAQDEKPAATASEGGEAIEDTEQEAIDPFAIPENASNKELLRFATRLMRMPVPEGQGRGNFAKKLFPARIKVYELVLEDPDDEKQITQAVTGMFQSYDILARFDPAAKEDFDKLIDEYASDERPEFAAPAIGYQLSNRASKLRGDASDAASLAEDTLTYLAKFGANRGSARTLNTVARTMGYAEKSDIAADLYEQAAERFEASDDEKIRNLAGRMRGSARRLNLLGNGMEVFGTNTTGEPVDWDSYRGQVVLVDFWASWCGPCLGELPNMKRNLERYGDEGFAILGINMDSTREAMDKCIESNDISWENIFVEEEGKMGWAAPMATHYGVSSIPTAILVDQQGMVVSLKARGKRLDKLLEEMLGPVAEESEDEKDSETKPDADNDQ